MKAYKIILLIVLIVFVALQFFPVHYNKGKTDMETDFIVVNQVPESVASKIKFSCYDCHSNNTHYPWYNKIQPVAWYLENHIKEGKSHLNFSEWSNYSDRMKNSKLSYIIEQVESGEMPMNSYTLIHREAILDSSDVNELVKYMESLKSN